MIKTMFDYIKEQKQVNNRVLNNRKTNMRSFIEYMENKSYKRWIVLATGSSANAIECSKYYVEKLLGVEIDIKMPFTFTNYLNNIDKDALYFAVSQGGHSYSTIEAVKKVKEHGCDVFVLTSDFDSPISQFDNNKILIDCGIEEVGFVTKGVTSTVLTFMLMGLEVSRLQNKVSNEIYNEHISNIISVIDCMDEIIDKSLVWYKNNKQHFINAERLVVIGYGSGYGVVKEAHTKFLETIRIPTNGYELEEYMHGPYLALSELDTIMFIETDSEIKERQRLLREYLQSYNKNIFTVTYDNVFLNEKDLYLNLNCDETLSALGFLIPIQILSYFVSEDRGNNLSKKMFADFDEKLKSKI